jgi:hypothetical protein
MEYGKACSKYSGLIMKRKSNENPNRKIAKVTRGAFLKKCPLNMTSLFLKNS